MIRNKLIFIYLNGCTVFLINLFYFLLRIGPLGSHCESHGRCNCLAPQLQGAVISMLPASDMWTVYHTQSPAY